MGTAISCIKCSQVAGLRPPIHSKEKVHTCIPVVTLLGTVPGGEVIDSGERETGQLVRVQSSHTTDSLYDELWLKLRSQASYQPVLITFL